MITNTINLYPFILIKDVLHRSNQSLKGQHAHMMTLDEEKIRKSATSRKAYGLLSSVSFLESALLPLPVDAVSIPMMIGAPSRAFKVANVALITSVLGGLLGYIIGYLFFEGFGENVITYYGLAEQFKEFEQTAKQDWWKAATAIFLGALTPPDRDWETV